MAEFGMGNRKSTPEIFIPFDPLARHPYRPYVGNDGSQDHFGEIYRNNSTNENSLVEKLSGPIGELVGSSIVSILRSVVASPFYVAQTLIQVQYLPKDLSNHKRSVSADPGEIEDGSAEIDTEQSYYQISSPPTTIQRVDTDGYIMRKNIYDLSTKPPYQLPPEHYGPWQMISTIARHPNEGMFALWKGQLCSWIYDTCFVALQPSLELSVNHILGWNGTVSLHGLEIDQPCFTTKALSSIITAILLSPFEIARTRLIVQTSSKEHQKYKGLVDCLKTLLREEGLFDLYFSPKFLYPNMAFYLASAIFEISFPKFIETYVFGHDLYDHPLLGSIVEVIVGILEIAILFPIDLIRKRLQSSMPHRENSTRPFLTTVAIRPTPYSGMIDCLNSILSEETNVHSLNKKGVYKRASLLTKPSDWILAPLYRGFQANLLSAFCQGGTDLLIVSSGNLKY